MKHITADCSLLISLLVSTFPAQAQVSASIRPETARDRLAFLQGEFTILESHKNPAVHFSIGNTSGLSCTHSADCRVLGVLIDPIITNFLTFKMTVQHLRPAAKSFLDHMCSFSSHLRAKMCSWSFRTLRSTSTGSILLSQILHLLRTKASDDLRLSLTYWWRCVS